MVKQRLAFFSPLPPAATGVADYAAALLGALAQFRDRVQIDIFSPNTASPLARRFPVYRVGEFPPRAGAYDARLYQLGNSSHYGEIYDTLCRYPGVVTLHDGTLHHLHVDRTLHRGNVAAYIREMTFSHGPRGYAVAQAVVRGSLVHPFYAFPLLGRAIAAATTVIVHSEAVQRAVLESRPISRVIRIDHLSFPCPPRGRSIDKRGKFMVVALGPASHSKRVETTLRSYERFVRTLGIAHKSQFLWVGANEAPEVRRLVQELGLREQVRFTGRVDEATLYAHLYAADAAINLRYPTSGEASGALMRLLAAGIPTIVSQTGWFAELPAGVVAHAPIGCGEVETAAAYLKALAENPRLRESMCAQAQAYARERTAERAAEEYLRALDTTAV